MINKKELSIRAIEVLESSGWTENRNVLQVIYPKDFVLPFYVQEIFEKSTWFDSYNITKRG